MSARTANWIAAARARESARSDRLFHDPWAAELAGPPGVDQLAGPENPFLPVRTRFFDDLLEETATWAAQVVLLGAGFDTRAYRLNLPADATVFELDRAEVFAAKEGVLATAESRCHRRTVACCWSSTRCNRSYAPGGRPGSRCRTAPTIPADCSCGAAGTSRRSWSPVSRARTSAGCDPYPKTGRAEAPT
jgi:hypothetical protein